jgi:hypothetical protein
MHIGLERAVEVFVRGSVLKISQIKNTLENALADWLFYLDIALLMVRLNINVNVIVEKKLL